MKNLLAFLISTSIAAPAFAQTPLGADEFEAWVAGQTYYSSRAGEEPYGMLLYRENREVTWASFGDECMEGYWTEPLPGVICFDYPSIDAQYCWQFYLQDGELFSLVFEGEGHVYYDQPTSDTMPCLAPYIGA